MFFTALKRATPVSFYPMDELENNEGKTFTAIQFDNICRIGSFCRRSGEKTEH